MKKCLLLLAFSITQFGCTFNNYRDTLNTWVGASVEQIVSVWGPPTNSYTVNETTTISYHNAFLKMHSK